MTVTPTVQGGSDRGRGRGRGFERPKAEKSLNLNEKYLAADTDQSSSSINTKRSIPGPLR